VSDLLPGQKFNKLLTEALRHAYDKGIERGKKRERERIIKLLEAPIKQESKLLDFNPNRTDFKFHHAKITIAKQFILLIEGDQK
jgi:hypothetical protein